MLFLKYIEVDDPRGAWAVLWVEIRADSGGGGSVGGAMKLTPEGAVPWVELIADPGEGSAVGGAKLRPRKGWSRGWR